MKRISAVLVILAATLSAMAQENKPAEGAFGIGFVEGFFPNQQNVFFSYMVKNNIEVGGTVGFQFNRNRNSTFDSLYVTGTGFQELHANRENKAVTTTANVFITPLFKYHFAVKNNLDVFLGANLPIGISPGTKTVNSVIVTADNYNSTGTTTTTAPVSVTVGAGVLLGCQYFFYKNLALGATANLGFSATVANGYDVTTITGSNSGSNNPATGTVIAPMTSRQQVKMDSEGAGMLHSFDLSLSWYFGNAEKKQ